MNVLVANSNNNYTYAFNASAKTLSISGVNQYSLDLGNLLSVYDVTTNSAFNFVGYSFSRSLDSNGLQVYTWTFTVLPVGAANADVLDIMISIPYTYGNYSTFNYISNSGGIISSFIISTEGDFLITTEGDNLVYI